MKIKIEDCVFAGTDHVRVCGVYEYGERKGEKFNFDESDFTHVNIDEAIEFFEDIAKQLKGLKDEDKLN